MTTHEDGSVATSMRSGGGHPTGATDSPDLKVLSENGVLRMGYLKKLKTMKKKFFVLREANAERPAALEYFDAQKKFDQGHAAKRIIPVSGSFAVNKKEDCEPKHAISIFTDKETFSVVANSEREQNEWLKDMIDLQRAGPVEGSPASETAHPFFDYVWNVDVRKTDQGAAKKISGPHRLCLLNRTLKLYPVGASPTSDATSFALKRLRSVGHNKKYFFIEIGRQTVTGPGQLCLEAEDVLAAQHMHDTISEEMRRSEQDETTTPSTTSGGRSRSNTDSSRPRQRDPEILRRYTYETTPKDRQGVVSENEMGARASSDLTPGSGGSTTSRERLNRPAEQRITEYAIPDFQHQTSSEDNYLPIDMDTAYFACNFQPVKPAATVESQGNYSAISKPAEHPRTAFPGLPAVAEISRAPLSPSIPEENGDYIPVTMPSRATASSISNQSGSNSSEESGYFEMNLPPKSVATPTESAKSPPPPASLLIPDRLPPVPEALPEGSPGAYIMMTPTAVNGTIVAGPSSDSRRSTMSSSSHQSYLPDGFRDEHSNTVSSEVTYAVMEPAAQRTRRENSSRDASTSSLGSSFGWDRLSSFGSRTDYRLEKVKAFMGIDDQDAKMRENRAYSTGCHPSKATSCFKPDPPSVPVHNNMGEPFRIRAYSLGNHSSPTASRGGVAAASSTTRQRGLVHSPSATLVLNLPSTSSDSHTVHGEIRLISASDTQLTPPNESGRLTPSLDASARKVDGGGGTRAEDLMELTFRPRSGS
ncbi:putative Insulin receptor substrate 1 [Hypsibius exemplaris]|uniref:Insulin receptor substrate 1 n=1 Tax=Hypsibius exemplaris TaxID=2072580 RepID=A0A9X6RLC7_HYPEX|nr:putative Insulin receptor substrate 1 [Hypsibius exemplaris]